MLLLTTIQCLADDPATPRDALERRRGWGVCRGVGESEWGGGLTLLLDHCSLKGFGTGNVLAYIAGGLWMVDVDSWWPLDG